MGFFFIIPRYRPAVKQILDPQAHFMDTALAARQVPAAQPTVASSGDFKKGAPHNWLWLADALSPAQQSCAY